MQNEIDETEFLLFGDDPTQDKNILPTPSFVIDSANQGEIGYKMVSQAITAHKPYSVAFVDMRMPPGWDGLETIQKIWELDPNIQIVICTAYADYSYQEIQDQLQSGSSETVKKF